MNAIIESSPNANTLWANILVDELARCGLRRAVASPGSRSTPLMLAFARHPDIELTTILDERSAAFFALGAAKVSGMPTAVICTSGTAAANHLPAVCEAAATATPLLLLTADRPAELQDAGALQTMRQRDLFNGHVRWFHETARPAITDASLRYLRSAVCRAFAACLGSSGGPVHVNVPFDKPLEPLPVDPDRRAMTTLMDAGQRFGLFGRRDGRPFTDIVTSGMQPDHGAVARLAGALRRARRPLIIAGPENRHTSDARHMMRCIDALGIPVFAEATSGLRFTGDDHPLILNCGDILVRSPLFLERMRPDLLILLGEHPTITALQQFIASCAGMPVFSITDPGRRVDPEFVVSMQIQAPRVQVFEALVCSHLRAIAAGIDARWRDTLTQLDRRAQEELVSLTSIGGEGLQAAFWHILPMLLPQGAAVVVSNSMPLRDLETFLKAAPQIDLFCNRGISGIDGVTSTAFGVATQIQRRTVLITGDLAFLHDLEILASSTLTGFDLTVFVLNNDGGEIFGTLPIAGFEPECTRHFITPHGLSVAAVTSALGIPAFAITNDDNHAQALRDMGRSQDAVSGFDLPSKKRIRVIEVRIDMATSLAWRRATVRGVRDVVDDFLQGLAVEPTPPERRRGLAWRRSTRPCPTPGRPVVLLHGFTRSSESWSAITPQCGNVRDFYAIDLMGHGQSPSPRYAEDPEAYSMEYQAACVLDALDSMGIQKPHLAGYSMGGRLALYLALHHPGHFTSLAAISAGPGIGDEEKRLHRAGLDQQLAEDIVSKGLAWFLDAWNRHPMLKGSSRDARAIDCLSADRWSQSAHGLAGSLLGMGQGAQQPLWHLLPGLTIPILCITGAEDTHYTDIVARMAERLPSLQSVVLPRAGHDILTDAPTLLHAELERFWAGVDAATT